MKKICLNCKEEFETEKSRKVFCHRRCGDNFLSRKKHREEGYGHAICQGCREDFVKRTSRNQTKCPPCNGFVSKEVRKLLCERCNKEFTTHRLTKRFCSKKCQLAAIHALCRREHGYGLFICLDCGQEFIRKSRKDVMTCPPCSIKKRKKFLDIPQCLAEANRKIDKKLGYVRVYIPMHPEANTRGYVYEHRVVAEQKIGRRLEKNEVVHHINGIRWDNRPENLEVMDRIEHSKLSR